MKTVTDRGSRSLPRLGFRSSAAPVARLVATALIAGSPWFFGFQQPGYAQGPVDPDLRQVVESLALTGDPSQGRNLPSIESPEAQLGMQLFFTKALSGQRDTACATCHHPLLGGGDAVSLSVGSQPLHPESIGTLRRHVLSQFFYYEGPPVGRNATTTFNVGLWDSVLFHDGRIESLGKSRGKNGSDGSGIRTPDTELGTADPLSGTDLVAAQARFPVVARHEMRGEFGFRGDEDHELLRSRLASRLGDYGAGRGELAGNSWLEAFRKVYGAGSAEELVTYSHIMSALSAYQRSQVFVDSPWKAYVEGDDGAIGPAAKRGALTFFLPVDRGGAQCSGCHTGDFFTDEKFYALAVPQVGNGKGDGPTGDDDYGRYRATKRPEDRYRFRTPSLLNVEVTGPYGHDGAYATLEAMIRHHLDPEAAVASYDASQLDPDVKVQNLTANTERALVHLRGARDRELIELPQLELNDGQIDDLVAFLNSLTDPCVKSASCLAAWIPAESMLDPDGLRLRARIDENDVAALPTALDSSHASTP